VVSGIDHRRLIRFKDVSSASLTRPPRRPEITTFDAFGARASAVSGLIDPRLHDFADYRKHNKQAAATRRSAKRGANTSAINPSLAFTPVFSPRGSPRCRRRPG
jgi:hypothetical protein